MRSVGWAAAARAAACLGAVAGLAGCSTSSTRTTSTVTVPGRTLTIVVSQAPGVTSDPAADAVLQAEELAFDQASSAASTHFHLQLRTITGSEISDIARTAIEDKTAIAYLGEIAPGSSEQSVGITNALDLPQISPTDTALELTQGTSAVSGAPNAFYESHSTYGRTFLRVAPSSALEAEAQVQEMKTLGVSSLQVQSDGSDYGRAVAQAVRKDAKAAGITLVSGASGAGGVFVGAASPTVGARLVNAAATAAPTAKLFGTSSLDASAFLSAVSAAAQRHLLISTPTLPAADVPGGASFLRSFKAHYPADPTGQAIFGYAAMSAALAAVREAGASADNRATVLKDLRGQHLGSLAFSSTGASTLSSFQFNHVRDGALVPTRGATAGG